MTKAETERLEKYRKFGLEACYLAACALHGKIPALNDCAESDDLYRFCEHHAITSIVTMALEEAWKIHPGDPETMKKWRQARDKAIRKNVLLNAERERILAHFESIGCWYMPLKGSLLQFDYPVFGMRQMSDNDILCDPEKSAEIREFMQACGYNCEQFMQGHHDEYNRKPVYNYEIHRKLFKPEEAPVLAAYYEDIHSRSLRDKGREYAYHLSPSDFYIYLNAHALNHFHESGIGIRWLMDVYVFLGKHQRELDWAYIRRELNKLGALDFEAWCVRISKLLFAEPGRELSISDEDMSLLYSFLASGSHGVESQLYQKSFAKFSEKNGNSRLRFFFSRMFPSARMLGVTYPVVKDHKWLVPFVWVYRLIRSVICRPGRVFREAKYMFFGK